MLISFIRNELSLRYMSYTKRPEKKNQKMNKENFRYYILIRKKLGFSPNEIYKELETAEGCKAPSKSTVQRWYNRFNLRKKNLKDQARSGAPITKSTKVNIERIRTLIEEIPNISIHEIEAETSLSYGTIQNILTNKLKMRKLTSRWAPHQLTEAQKIERVNSCKENLNLIKSNKIRLCDIITGDESWFFHKKLEKKITNQRWVKEGESPATIVRPGKFDSKTMFTIFFKNDGPVLITYLERGQTIDAESYIENCLKPIVSTLNLERPRSGAKSYKIHDDNARPHVHKSVNNFLTEHGIKTIRHPPYSPDLAPCDFWLFSYIKERLDSHDNAISLSKQITKVLSAIDKKEWQKTFHKWIERMETCIKCKGEYFEHLVK